MNIIKNSLSLFTKIVQHCGSTPNKLTIPTMLKYKDINPNNTTKIVHEELKHRLAYKILCLEDMPYGLGQMPSIKKVTNWYIDSYRELDEWEQNNQIRYSEKYNEILANILKRHAPTFITMSKGIFEWKNNISSRYGKNDDFFESNVVSRITDNIDKKLNTFYDDRISTRLIISHHLSIGKQEIINQNINKKDNYVGIINLKTNPIEIIKHAYEDVNFISNRDYGIMPNVKINDILISDYANNDILIPYIPSHMYHIFFEVLKNASRATLDKYVKSNNKELNDINIFTSESSNNFSIKISDSGTGIKRLDIPKVWSYFYSTAPRKLLDMTSEEQINDFDKSAPIAGFGYGMPITKLHVNYFKGHISINSIDGVGTDVNIYF